MLKCDFCSAPAPIAAYPVRVGVPWAACEECALLIDAGEIQQLARRAMRTLLGGEVEMLAQRPDVDRVRFMLAEAIKAMHYTFWHLRTGPRQPVGPVATAGPI